jgi:hypothetical protein
MTEQQDAPEQSITELLEANFDKLEHGEAANVAEPVEDAPGDTEAAGRAEDADPAADAGAEDSAHDEVDDAPAPAAVAAPEHWSQADKDRFAKLPPESRQWWLDKSKDLERGYQEKFREASSIRKEADEIVDALRPVDSIIQQRGMSRADAVARLVGADQLLRQDFGQGISAIVEAYGRPVAGTDQARNIVRQFAQRLGVDVGGAGEQPSDQAKVDPRIAELERTVHEMRDQARAQAEQQVAQHRQSAQAKIDAFREAKDGSGAALHPHYEAVKAVMGALMATANQSGEALTLEDAYERAVWSRPDLREALTKAQQEAAAKAADEARRSKVAKAKAAGTPRTTSAQTRELEPDHSNKSTRQLLEDAYDRMAGDAR